MPTIKPGSKAETKAIAAQVTTPRRARKKGKKNNHVLTSPDQSNTIDGDGRCGQISVAEQPDRTRSRSRGRKILDAAVARISFGRSRSKSVPKSNSRGIEISGPIVGTRITSEMFGPSGFLTQNSVTESGQNNAVGVSDSKANGQSRLPLSSTGPMNPEEREQLLRTPQSWEGISSDRSLISLREPRSFSRHSSIRAVPQSPKTNATDRQCNRSTILSRLVSHNPNSPDALCAVCSQRITAEDRYELIDQIMHRYCFKCALCGTDAGAKSQEPVKGKEEKGPNASEKRLPNVGAQRMGNLREKFEKGQMTEKKKKKTAPKIKYAGADAVKNKFIETATKASNGSANGPKGPKEFTPPPEGVTVGVLESKPKPRAPDVVTAEDSLEPVDLTVIGETTKNLRAKFKHLEETGGQDDEEEKSHQNALIDEFKTVGTEALRSARGRWKDIESGKVDALETSERPKIDIRGEGYGGVFENEPEKFENIARAGEFKTDLPSGISAKERREEFLRKANETSIVKKEPTKIDINAAESGIYENEPARRDDVVRYDDEQAEDYPPTTVKWASEAKNRFIQEASKAQERIQRAQPVADGEGAGSGLATQAKQALLEKQKQEEEAARNKARPDIIDIWGEQCAHSGVFENTPAAPTADVVAGHDSEESEEESAEEEQ